MRFMHNSDGCHAFRETATSRLDPPDSTCSHCGGDERHGGGIHAAAEPACGEPRPGDVQDDLLLRSPHGFELTLRGRKILQELEGLLPAFQALITSARLCSPACAGGMQTNATKRSLNSF